MIYITGDTHRDFDRIRQFCLEKGTTRNDVIIILGDAGINEQNPMRDRMLKEDLAGLPATLFCVYGNHEQRPERLPGYHPAPWRGGQVYVEDDFPNLLFARDGELYDLDGIRAIVIGGAYSVDKMLRIARGLGWWPDEQPSPEIRARVEAKLAALNWKVDVVLSHTVPLKYEPTEVFLPGLDQSRVDKSTETWLDDIESQLDYRGWFAGHYHTEKTVRRLRIMFENIEPFRLPEIKPPANIVVTGFEPFGGATVNASWEAVKTLDGVRRELLPVTFEGAAERVRALAAEGPDAIICVGEAGGRSAISLERVAVNLMDARIPDNAGFQPENVPALPGGPQSYFSTLPLGRMLGALRQARVPAGLSMSAGSYVCNSIFYALMDALAAGGNRTIGGFIHVPARGMSPARIAKGLRAALDALRA